MHIGCVAVGDPWTAQLGSSDKMKVTIERAHLLKSLGHVQSVVERRNTIPILSNVKVQAEDGELRLTATDMDLEVVESVAAVVATAGATTVAAHTLYDIVRKLPDGAQVEFEIRLGRRAAQPAVRPVALHPALPADRGLSGADQQRTARSASSCPAAICAA